MSRSGNHAIINWMLAQAGGTYCFLNCVEPKTNPFHTARPITGEESCRTNAGNFDLERERKGLFSRKDYLIYSYEDCFLGMVCSEDFERKREQYVGSSRRQRDVLILRDPFNLFASHACITPSTAVRIWKQHTREFTRRGRYLNGEKVLIKYNAWVRSAAYRRSIARQLGLDFTDAGVQEVARCGAGSSFDGMQFDGRAGEMGVLERWRHFAEDSAYQRLFDAEVVGLSEELFGVLPGTEDLFQETCYV